MKNSNYTGHFCVPVVAVLQLVVSVPSCMCVCGFLLCLLSAAVPRLPACRVMSITWNRPYVLACGTLGEFSQVGMLLQASHTSLGIPLFFGLDA